MPITRAGTRDPDAIGAGAGAADAERRPNAAAPRIEPVPTMNPRRETALNPGLYTVLSLK
ncbi:hypothetical protein GCM10009550_32170 [Actinocorallia libanotica]|uniref:Uncharacterized protein n=1 Tax=Actinocorallia libanotica TaxID=46162 RepID=A0ABP4BPE9_9ACTN